MKQTPDVYPLYEIRPPYTTLNRRLRVDLYEEVLGYVFEKAVNKAVDRYPYLKVEIKTDEEGLDLVPNRRPVTVQNTDAKPAALGSEAANRHLISAQYFEKSIWLTYNSAIAGNNTVKEFLKTIMMVYFRDLYNTEFSTDGVRMPGEPVEEGEYALPDKSELQKARKLGRDDDTQGIIPDYHKMQMPFSQSLGYGRSVYYGVEINRRQLMTFSGRNDSSPEAAAACFMYLTLRKVFADKTDVISCAFNHDCSEGVGCPDTHYNLSSRYTIQYFPDKDKSDLLWLGTKTRGRSALLTCGFNERYEINRLFDYYAEIDKYPTLKEKRAFCKREGKYTEKELRTFSVRYIGSIDWGPVKKYIKSIYPITEGHLNIDVAFFGDKLFFSFHQVTKKMKYLDELLAVLEENKISYKLSGPFDRNLPSIEIG